MGEEDDEEYTPPKRPYADQLMAGEWMKALPDDLAANWLFVMCPVGKRCLVISAKGRTMAYGRNGKCITKFPSSLPGGARKQRASARGTVRTWYI